MRRVSRVTVETFGYFFMVLLGAFLSLGLIAVMPIAIARCRQGHTGSGCWLLFFWIAVPAAGIAVIARALKVTRGKPPRG